MTANQIAYQRQLEEGRANLARETETHRANTTAEQQRAAELAENSRHNLVTEAETNRSNVARETETRRSNLAKELETSQHNRAAESIGYGQLSESRRHNVATENLTGNQIGAGIYSAQLNYASSKYRTDTERDSKTAQRKQDSQINFYNQQEQNKRTQAEIIGRQTAAETQGFSGIANSLIRFIGGRIK